MTPELVALLEDGETMADLKKMSPETILIRWVNWHLKNAGQARRIKNLGGDVSDSWALFHTLNQLNSKKCTLDGIDNTDLVSRADKMIGNSKAIGVPDVCSA